MAGALILMKAGAAPATKLLGEKEIADKLQFYRSIDTLKVNFVETKHLSEMALDLKSEGKMELKAPAKVTWEILKPSHVLIKIDPNGIEMTSASGTQSFKLQDLSQDNAARGVGLLLPWLSFDAKALSEQYKIVETGPHSFEFTPKGAKTSITKMTADLTARGSMHKLKLFETSGDSLTIQFSNPQVTRLKP